MQRIKSRMLLETCIKGGLNQWGMNPLGPYMPNSHVIFNRVWGDKATTPLNDFIILSGLSWQHPSVKAGSLQFKIYENCILKAVGQRLKRVLPH